jgi:hypothetical protein
MTHDREQLLVSGVFTVELDSLLSDSGIKMAGGWLANINRWVE